MTDKVLVTYASRAGSTEEIAGVIGNILAAKGSKVDLLPIQEVDSLESYRAIVAGSAVQNRQWLPEAHDFVEKHRIELSDKPFAMFSVCMTLAVRDGEKYRPQIAGWLEPVRSKATPLCEGLFAGVLDISKIPGFNDRLKFRLSVAFGVWSEGDHRDWEAINAWANDLNSKLSPMEGTPR